MCQKCRVLFFSVVTVSCLLLVSSFNIETFHYVLHNGRNDSMFGFSVATHREQGRSWVIVGAPSAQSDYSIARSGGVVYKCPTTSDNGCDEIVFNDERSEPTSKPIDDKDHQWFGATVSSAGPDLPIVACAPRYVWFSRRREQRRDPVGTCYITKNNFKESAEYSPCRTSLFGYHRQGLCQAGFSAGMSKDGKRLFIGAPGSWYWQGQMYSIDPSITFPFTPGIFGEAFGYNVRQKGQVIQQSLDNRPAVMSTPEGPPQDDNSYMGYSMVVGDFNNEGVQGVAVGMPNSGEELKGKVLLYTWALTNYLNITAKEGQMGSYFGYALANSDIDGDKRDDLIIGAPMFTEKNNEKKYEVGRIYIVYQGYDGSFSKQFYIDGTNSKSRFGLALSTLGDLNLDGYGDFAVGAPYDGPNERGAVYIFQGSADGVIKKYSQVIFAEDVQGIYPDYHPVTTFGFSIAGGLDLDGNDYPDVAIGAYLSDKAFFFRARPVVKVEAVVRFLTPNKQIFLDQKDCEKPDNPSVKIVCTFVEVCMRYTGIGTPSRVGLDVQYIIDSKKSELVPRRMYLGRGRGRTINATLELVKDAPLNCALKDRVYFEEQIVDKLTELVIEVKYSLRDTRFAKGTYRDPRSILLPIVDLSKAALARDSIIIYKNCGADNVCTPDLRIKVIKKVGRYIYEIGKSLEFLIQVTNYGEDAYNSKYYVVLPNGIGFKVAKKVDNPDAKVSCTSYNASTFVCDIGNPFPKDSVLDFVLEVEPLRDQKLLSPTYYFYMNVTSANTENDTLEDNVARISVDVWVDAVLYIENNSIPLNIYYNPSHYPQGPITWDNEIGPTVIHSYTITNKGPSDVEAVEIFIIWPYATARGEDLLYLLEQPYTYGGVHCETADANYKAYSLTAQKNIWEALQVPITYYENATGLVGTQNFTIIPGLPGDVITTTEIVAIYYDQNQNEVHQEKISPDANYEKYWKQISKFVNTYFEPLTVRIKSTIHMKYSNGTVINQASSRPGIPEVPYKFYKIKSNVTSFVQYYDINNQLLYEEMISEEPGTLEFNKRVKSTTDRYTFPLVIHTNSTREINYLTANGKLLHQEILNKFAIGNTTNVETSKIGTVVNIIFYDEDGIILHEEPITTEPGTAAYWEQINTIASKYTEPITIRTHKSKEIIYYINGIEVRREAIPGILTALEAPFRSHLETTTTVTCFDSKNNILQQKTIPGESGTILYKNLISTILKNFTQPITVTTNTTKVITYRTSGGKIVYTGFMHDQKSEMYNQNQKEFTKVDVSTVISFYGINGRLLHKQNITDEPGTPEYWENINKIINEHPNTKSIYTQTTKTITYYLDGKEAHTDKIPSAHKAPLTIDSDYITNIACYGKDRNILYKTSVPENVDSPSVINAKEECIAQFSKPLLITTNNTKINTFTSADGKTIYKGIVSKIASQSYGQDEKKTHVITYETLIKIYDSHGNRLHEEKILDNPGSTEYWGKINKIVNNYQVPVNIHTTSTKILKYYINGIEVGQETKPEGPKDVPFSTYVDVSTSVICQGTDGGILYQSNIIDSPQSTAYKDLINTIIKKFNRPITITTNTTKTITYFDANRRVVHVGVTSEQTKQSYHQNQGETMVITYITVVKFYGSDGNFLHEELITDEPGTSTYWQKINKISSEYAEPINIHTTTSKTITYYVNGVEVRKEPAQGGPQELTFTTLTDFSTTIICRGSNGKILYQTKIADSLESNLYKNTINSIINKFPQPITVVTSTTKTTTYVANDGTISYTGFITKENTQHYHNQEEISKITFVTVVKFYDPYGKLLVEETITDEPGTSVYWEKINKIINNYSVPVKIETITTKTITYYINGVEVRKEPIPEKPQQNPFTTRVDITTSITCRDTNGKILYETKISDSPKSSAYQDLINNLINTYSQPITITTSTTKTIIYIGVDGRISHTGYVTEENIQKYHQDQKKISRITFVTIVRFYGPDGGFLREATVTDEPGSAAYWQKINKIINEYSVPINIHTKTTKTIVYYINGVEVSKEPMPGSQETPFTVHTDFTTAITCRGIDGSTIYTTTIPGSPETPTYKNLIRDLTSRYQQPLSITTNTTKITTYRNSDGRIVYTGTNYEQKTENYNNTRQTERFSFLTIVKFYDNKGKLLHEETITHEPETKAYWDAINKVISRYVVPITIRITTTKTVTFYMNGVEMRQETVPGGMQETPFTTHIDTTTVVTCYGNDGKILYQNSVSGDQSSYIYKELVASIVNRFTQPITISTNTTKIIRYKDTGGREIYVGTITEQFTKNYHQTQRETSRISTISNVKFYGSNGNFLHEEVIMDAPASANFWKKLDKVVTNYHDVITIHTETKKVITYYVNNKEVRSEQVPGAAGVLENPVTSHLDVTTIVTCYGNRGNVVSTKTLPGERGSAAYNNYITDLTDRYREYLTLHINTTRTISYRSSEGIILHQGFIFEQATESLNPTPAETTRITVLTTISFYDSNGRLVHKNTIKEQPGSGVYWDYIKNIIQKIHTPLNIYTNTSQVITYYANGREIRSETVPGNAGTYEHPFTTHQEISNVITYYSPDKKMLHQETVKGELTQADRNERVANFAKTYSGSFTMETTTTKVIVYRTNDGQILHSDQIAVPGHGIIPDDFRTSTTTETTFTVYGPDRRTILHEHTIEGEPGSAAYNNYLAEIISKFSGAITIYTNSTKKITFYNTEGKTVSQQSVSEPRSTIHRGSGHADVTTSITFYGPDGQTLHQDTIHGAPGPELYNQLNQIAKAYGGIVKSNIAKHNSDGSIAGTVTQVDTPYPGHRPETTEKHFTDFQFTNYSHGSSSHSFSHEIPSNLQDLSHTFGSHDNANYRTGNVGYNFDGHARNQFENYREVNPQSHNYLNSDYFGSNRETYRRHKRQEDTTDRDIEILKQCKTSKCAVIKCSTGPMGYGHEVRLALRARISVQALKNISTTETVKIQSMLLARISKFQEISGPPAQRNLYRQAAVTSITAPQPIIKPDIVPLWVVIVSAVAGTLILLLLIFLMYKCGFFNRNRPSDAPERQPLNRNGHFQHGDEAL